MGITIKAFNVTIEKIPLGGLAIKFDNRVFSFLLLLALIYFLPILLIYYFIDIRNFNPTKHQQNVLGRYNERIGAIPNDYITKVIARMNAAVAPELTVKASEHWGSFLQAAHYTLIPGSYKLVQEAGNVELNREDAKKQYDDADRVLDRMLRRYSFQRNIQIMWRALPRYSTELVYLFRNYVTDGALPTLLALFAIGALLDFYSVQWLQLLVPATKNPTD
jgi:hypothetical protein